LHYLFLKEILGFPHNHPHFRRSFESLASKQK